MRVDELKLQIASLSAMIAQKGKRNPEVAKYISLRQKLRDELESLSS